MTKDEIVKAAFKVWGRELYQAMSLTVVARELGVSKAALYRHFDDKESLLATMDIVFFDEFTAFVKKEYERAAAAGNLKERYLIMIRIISEYYGRNIDAFTFGLFRIFTSWPFGQISEQLVLRGVDLGFLFQEDEGASRETESLSLLQLVMISISFWLAQFHQHDHKSGDIPSDAEIRSLVRRVEGRIDRGLNFHPEKNTAVDYSLLEERCAAALPKEKESNRFFDAIAGAVAEAGPREATVEMVARRLGITKSSLYAHFYSKQDMITKFYFTEFARLAEYTRGNIESSSAPAEQLYLVLVSVTAYLRSRPEILISMDWFRTWRVNLGPVKTSGSQRILPEIYRIITDIDIPAFKKAGAQKNRFAQWILFLIVSSLMWRREPGGVSSVNLRMLFGFITGGLGGFNL